MAAPQFEKISTELEDVFILQRTIHEDNRGVLGKLFNKMQLKKIGINLTFEECIYNISGKNVLRGMHYQKEPYSHEKLITVIQGSIKSVLVGTGNNKGKIFSIDLSSKNMRSLLISKNYAHGFLSYEDNTIWVQNSTKVFSPEYYGGFHWNSFGFDWQIKSPIISEKDNLLPDYN